MLYENITKKILESCFEVSNELGFGYAENQIPLMVKFRGEVVGEFFVDILVEEKVLIELKVANGLSKENYAQVINYLKATGIEVGLLVNFGTPKIEYRRFTNKFNENENNIRDVFK